MVSMTANDYQMRVEYSSADRGFLATVREFPHLYYVGMSKLAAKEGLAIKLNAAIGARRHNDSAIPAPQKFAYAW